MTPELVDTCTSIFSNVATGVTAIALVVIAIKGLQAWRQQMVGQSRYEAARRLLLLARRFRGAFGRSRGPATRSNEYAERPRGEDETPAQKQVLDEQYARLNRLQPAADILAELEQAVWEAEVVTGEALVQLAKPFGLVLQELNLAIVKHFYLRSEVANGHTITKQQAKEQQRLTKLIYEPHEDDLTRRVDEALAALEEHLKKYIR